MIKYLGGIPVPYIFKETDKGFEIDMVYLKSKVTSKTRIFIYNNYSNPLGVTSSEDEMNGIFFKKMKIVFKILLFLF